MIEKYGGDNKDYYYTRLLNQHNINIEFEAINGFEYDVNTKLNIKFKWAAVYSFSLFNF